MQQKFYKNIFPVILNEAKRSELAVCRGRQLVADHAQMHATGERVQANSRRLKNRTSTQLSLSTLSLCLCDTSLRSV